MFQYFAKISRLQGVSRECSTTPPPHSIFLYPNDRPNAVFDNPRQIIIGLSNTQQL